MNKKTLSWLLSIALVLALVTAVPAIAGASAKGSAVNTTPFQFPLSNMYEDITGDSDFYSYTVGSAPGNLTLDGDITEVSGLDPFMSEYVVPGTLHPPGIIYAWVMNDDENLYLAFDVTPDNTMDGQQDYVKVYINTDEGVKVFKVTLVERTWGETGFTPTERADYRHKVYELAIPLSEAGSDIADGSVISLAFSAYGTMGAPPAISINDVTVGEGNTATFTVTLTIPRIEAFPITVKYETTPITASEGYELNYGDYDYAAGTVEFAVGSRTQTITVITNEDTIYEGDETFSVDLYNAVNATIINGQGVGIGTITDNDGLPSVALSISPGTLAEDGGVSTVTATLSGSTVQDVTVSLAYTGTATGPGTDYTTTATSILVPAGKLTGTSTITAVDDSIVEGDESITIDITSVANAVENGTQTVSATILDDDTSISITEMLGEAKDYVETNKQYFGKISGSVIKKIDNITVKWKKGDTAKAVEQLQSLISAVTAQSGKNIQPEKAEALTQMLEEILAAMNQT
jgi:hypothetical protein